MFCTPQLPLWVPHVSLFLRDVGFAGLSQYINPLKAFPARNIPSVPFLVFRDPSLHDLLDQPVRQRLFRSEVNRSF
jgi:hypothetical protein